MEQTFARLLRRSELSTLFHVRGSLLLLRKNLRKDRLIFTIVLRVWKIQRKIKFFQRVKITLVLSFYILFSRLVIRSTTDCQYSFSILVCRVRANRPKTATVYLHLPGGLQTRTVSISKLISLVLQLHQDPGGCIDTES